VAIRQVTIKGHKAYSTEEFGQLLMSNDEPPKTITFNAGGDISVTLETEDVEAELSAAIDSDEAKRAEEPIQNPQPDHINPGTPNLGDTDATLPDTGETKEG
jgi:hypothetical protein